MENKQWEKLIVEIVAYFKKWALWKSIMIFNNGKWYSSYAIEGSTEGTGDLSRVYIAPASYDMTADYIDFYREQPESEPLMMLSFEGTIFYEMISYGFYKAPVLDISDDALMFIAEKENLLNEYVEEYQLCPILDYTEFKDYGEYQLMEEEMEEQDILDRLRESGPILCSRETIAAILKEFDNIFARYGFELYPLGMEIWGYVCFEGKAIAETN